MTGLLSWIIFGLIAGAIAKMITPGGGGNKDTSGCITTMIIGIIGAGIGGFIGTQLGWGTIDGFDLKSFGLAIGGAILLLFIFQLVSKKQ
jgi:uncharacterized membrane protein YeaQ/YmgE (transglycosylase-associated protein family)